MAREIGGRDHVARHCSPMNMGQNGTTLHGAFQIKKSEQFLSVSWVEYFGKPSMEENMAGVRRTVGLHRDINRKDARFAVIGVERAKRTVMNKHGKILAFKDLQERHFPSHSGIYGYGPRDMRIAHTLAELVGENDVHPTVCNDP